MDLGIHRRIFDRVVRWLNRERPLTDSPPCDFERLCYEIRPGDVLLVEGRSRVADVIKSITLSNWTHAALYIGRLHDIDAPEVRELVREYYPAEADEQLILEALLGYGTIIAPLSKYRTEHLRICRPREICRRDAQTVIGYCAGRLGREYDVRHLFDLARFLVPYNILPRRWRSSLFARNAAAPTRTICSSLLAQAFAEVRYPVLPVLRRDDRDQVHMQKRNFRLFTPRDFDYSPYFDVIKYPVLAFDDLAVYHRLPWDPDTVFANAPGDEFVLPTPRAAAVSGTASAAADSTNSDEEDAGVSADSLGGDEQGADVPAGS